MGRFSWCAFVLCFVCQLRVVNAGSVFSLDEVVNLRSAFFSIDDGDIEFESIGDISLDVERDRLYIRTREGLVVMDEQSRLGTEIFSDRLDDFFLLRKMNAFTVDPESGNLYIYDVLCPTCVGTTLPFLAEMTTLSPQGEVLAYQQFQPFRFEDGVAGAFHDMVIEPGGNLRMFLGGTSVTLDLDSLEFGTHVRYAQDFSFAAGGVFDPITGHLFGLTEANVLYEFDATTRDVLSITQLDELVRYPFSVPGARRPFGMTFSADGNQLFITTKRPQNNPGSGELVVLNRTVVPEPSTIALASIAVGLAVMQRRRLRSGRWTGRETGPQPGWTGRETGPQLATPEPAASLAGAGIGLRLFALLGSATAVLAAAATSLFLCAHCVLCGAVPASQPQRTQSTQS